MQSDVSPQPEYHSAPGRWKRTPNKRRKPQSPWFCLDSSSDHGDRNASYIHWLPNKTQFWFTSPHTRPYNCQKTTLFQMILSSFKEVDDLDMVGKYEQDFRQYQPKNNRVLVYLAQRLLPSPLFSCSPPGCSLLIKYGSIHLSAQDQEIFHCPMDALAVTQPTASDLLLFHPAGHQCYLALSNAEEAAFVLKTINFAKMYFPVARLRTELVSLMDILKNVAEGLENRQEVLAQLEARTQALLEYSLKFKICCESLLQKVKGTCGDLRLVENVYLRCKHIESPQQTCWVGITSKGLWVPVATQAEACSFNVYWKSTLSAQKGFIIQLAYWLCSSAGLPTGWFPKQSVLFLGAQVDGRELFMRRDGDGYPRQESSNMQYWEMIRLIPEDVPFYRFISQEYQEQMTPLDALELQTE